MTNIYSYYLNIKESNIFIKSDLPESFNLANNLTLKFRRHLEQYISTHQDFLSSFEPIKIAENAPKIIKKMKEATDFIPVGPMAAVAGAIADLILMELEKNGSKTSIVENGGEIAAISIRDIIVGLLAGKSILSGKIGFKLKKDRDFPFGLGTSSRGGRGFSFGLADAATVIANNASIGDAAATYIGNKVIGDDIEKSIQTGLEAAEDLDKIRGVFIIRGKYAGKIGELPEMVKIKGNLESLYKRKYEYKLDQDYVIL